MMKKAAESSQMRAVKARRIRGKVMSWGSFGPTLGDDEAVSEDGAPGVVGSLETALATIPKRQRMAAVAAWV